MPQGSLPWGIVASIGPQPVMQPGSVTVPAVDHADHPAELPARTETYPEPGFTSELTVAHDELVSLVVFVTVWVCASLFVE